MVLLRVRFRPAAEELVHGGDAGFEIVLHGPEREVAADVCVEGGEHGGPLAAVFLSMMSRVSRHSSLVLTGLVFVFVVWDGKAVRSAVRD